MSWLYPAYLVYMVLWGAWRSFDTVGPRDCKIKISLRELFTEKIMIKRPTR
jgi:hypothetical protein